MNHSLLGKAEGSAWKWEKGYGREGKQVWIGHCV